MWMNTVPLVQDHGDPLTCAMFTINDACMSSLLAIYDMVIVFMHFHGMSSCRGLFSIMMGRHQILMDKNMEKRTPIVS